MKRCAMDRRREIYEDAARDYKGATKAKKTEVLNSLVLRMGLHRNYAARLLRTHNTCVRVGKNTYVKADITKKGKRPGRRKYYDAEVEKLLKFIWELSGFLCGKRLKAVLNEIIDNLLQNNHLTAPSETIEKLRQISASTIDRLLKPERKKIALKGRKGTKPGTLLKNQVEVRTWADWNENMPGFMEIDLVGHEGGNSRGDFAQTLTMVDVWSGWTEIVALKNKASIWVRQAIERVKRRLPFELRGLDSDTGAEFINHPMSDWCKVHGVKFTRGRSTRSNDNCYVEQKNYSIVRQNVGYWRYDTDEEVYWLNRLYAYLRLYANFFQPVMKMTKRERIGGKVRKEHNDIKTPYQRLVNSPHLDDTQKERLQRLYHGLDILHLKTEITRCQRKLWNIQKRKRRWYSDDSGTFLCEKTN